MIDDTGWISIHRKITDNPLWLSEPFTRAQAWIDLLIIANHKPGYIYVRGNKIELDRGQIGWSVQKLAKRWRWSVGKVNRYLNELEIEQQIVKQKNFVSTVITIAKYNDYQKNETQIDRQTGKQTGEQTGKQTERRRLTNNNDNNNNKKSAPSFLNSFLADFPQVKPEYQLRGKGEVEINTTKAMILKICELNGAGQDEARWYYNKLDDDGFFNRKGFPMKVNEMVEDLTDLFRRKWVKKMSEKEFRELNG